LPMVYGTAGPASGLEVAELSLMSTLFLEVGERGLQPTSSNRQ
jgi:hypothetical protein